MHELNVEYGREYRTELFVASLYSRIVVIPVIIYFILMHTLLFLRTLRYLPESIRHCSVSNFFFHGIQ